MSWAFKDVEEFSTSGRKGRVGQAEGHEQRLGGLKIHGLSEEYGDVGVCIVKKQKMRPQVCSES